MCVKHSLPLGFLIGLVWAILWPEPGQAVASVVVGQSAHDPRGIRLFEFLCNVNIFMISGLTLRLDDFRGLMKEWRAPVYGLLTVLLLTPTLALGLKVRVDGTWDLNRSIQSSIHVPLAPPPRPQNPPPPTPSRSSPSRSTSSPSASPSSPWCPPPSAPVLLSRR